MFGRLTQLCLLGTTVTQTIQTRLSSLLVRCSVRATEQRGERRFGSGFSMDFALTVGSFRIGQGLPCHDPKDAHLSRLGCKSPPHCVSPLEMSWQRQGHGKWHLAPVSEGQAFDVNSPAREAACWGHRAHIKALAEGCC